jgi:hypothetical protein
MREPGNNYLKAWAREYEETPFFFEQKWKGGVRLIAWSEESDQIQKALYAIIESLPWDIEVLLKVSAGDGPDGKPLWSRYHGNVNRSQLLEVIQANERYVFSDGSNQLCVKDPNSDRHLAFDEHGIFFLYSPLPLDTELFEKLGFEQRYAEPIFAMPHFKRALEDSEQMEQKFVATLQLNRANSDLDK